MSPASASAPSHAATRPLAWRRASRPDPYGGHWHDRHTRHLSTPSTDAMNTPMHRPTRPPTRIRPTRPRTTRLNAPGLSRERLSTPPSITPLNIRSLREAGSSPVGSWGVGATQQQAHIIARGQAYALAATSSPVITLRDARQRHQQRQPPSLPSVAPCCQAPKPEIPLREYQETLQIAGHTKTQKSQGCKGVLASDPSDATCHVPDMDTLRSPEPLRRHPPAVWRSTRPRKSCQDAEVGHE